MKSDILIVGAGIVGLTIARELSLRGFQSITVLEKEAETGLHTSGRNSGVLHGGIYYPVGSLKAKLCVEGIKLMKDYAVEKGIPLMKTGKVIVVQNPELDSQIDTLFERAQACGANVEIITTDDLKKIEPAATTHKRALYSPETSVIDSKKVVRTIEKELLDKGIKIIKSAEVRRIDTKKKKVITSNDEFEYSFLVNTAGLHADRIAHMMGVGKEYRILPFKGTYQKLTPQAATAYKGSIYPVPDLRFPFLGVHITRTISNDVYVGPTAIPAFGRENYNKIKDVSFTQTPGILKDLTRMIAINQNGIRKLIFQELPKYTRHGFYDLAKALSPNLTPEDLLPSNKVGIRAQLVNVSDLKFVMDFLIEPGPSSAHVLNAVSPAFTASFAFAKHFADQYLPS